MRRALAAMIVLALALFLMWAWPRPPVEGTPPSPPTLVRSEAPVREVSDFSTAFTPEREDTAAEVREPSPYLTAHAAVAEALGYVAISCWVGTEYDAYDIVRRQYQQRIANGWYTAVVTQLEGQHVVEGRFERADVPEGAHWTEKYDFETLFVVSWKADAPGGVVPCEVRSQRYATLRIRVVDQDRLPVPGATVYCCSAGGKGDTDGLVVLEQAHAGGPYKLTGYRRPDEVQCEGVMLLEPLEPDEIREVEFELLCFDDEELQAGLGARWLENDFRIDDATEKLPAVSTAEELARLRALRATPAVSDEGRELLDELIRQSEHAWVGEEIQRRIDETEDPIERSRLQEEFWEHLSSRSP